MGAADATDILAAVDATLVDRGRATDALVPNQRASEREREPDTSQPIGAPMQGELMADLVVAADGHVYERKNIERHFEAERERLAAPQTSECDAARDDACCGAPRERRQHYNSPMGGPLHHTQLLPVRAIVSLIEGAIDLQRVDAAEARDWRERREAAIAVTRQREAMEGPAAAAGNGEEPRGPHGIKRGWMMLQMPGGFVREPGIWRYFVLSADKLAIYDAAAETPFPLTAYSTACIQHSQLSLRTPDARRDKELVLGAPAGAAPPYLEEWCDAISSVIAALSTSPPYPALSTSPPYEPSAGDVRIIASSQPNPSPVTGLAVAMCAEAALLPKGSVGRCMVRSCSRAIVPTEGQPRHHASHQCGRCGRVVCLRCGDYEAFSFEEVVIDEAWRVEFTRPETFRLCVECFEDAVGRIEARPQVEEDGPLRSALADKLDAYEAEEQRDRCGEVEAEEEARFQQEESVAAQAHEREMVALSERIRRAEAAAAEAAATGGTLTGDYDTDSLHQRVAALQERRSTLLTGGDEDEEQQERRVLELSGLEAQLEDAQLRLVVAASQQQQRVFPPTPSPSPSSRHVPTSEANVEEAEEGLLPRGWGQRHDPSSGRSYFYKLSTLESTWERPTDPCDDTAVLPSAEQQQQQRVFPPAVQRVSLPPDRGFSIGRFIRSLFGDKESGESSSAVSNHGELPLGIAFPTERGRAREARVLNHVELCRAEARSRLEAQRTAADDARESRAEARRMEAAQAEGQAEEAARRATERRQERERMVREAAAAQECEQERLRREAERLEVERRERIRQAAAQAEASTVESLRRNEGQGNTYGHNEGRMCRRCRCGPVYNRACNDMHSHNDGGRNACPHCGWFSRDWTDWLEWDGVYGPH